jgi:hypothetical protein
MPQRMNLFPSNNHNLCNLCNLHDTHDTHNTCHTCNACRRQSCEYNRYQNTYQQSQNNGSGSGSGSNSSSITQKIDQQLSDKVFNNFMAEYYRNVSTIGWNVVTNLFDPQCVVLYRDKNIGNAFALLNTLSVDYIKRANYSNIRAKWIVPDINTMIINVFGFMVQDVLIIYLIIRFHIEFKIYLLSQFDPINKKLK